MNLTGRTLGKYRLLERLGQGEWPRYTKQNSP